MARFDASHEPGTNIMTNDELRAVVQTLENGVRGVQTPLQRLEHLWHLPVAFLVIPVFALFNAGIPLEFGALADTLSHPVTLGVGLGPGARQVHRHHRRELAGAAAGHRSIAVGTRFSQIAGVRCWVASASPWPSSSPNSVSPSSRNYC